MHSIFDSAERALRKKYRRFKIISLSFVFLLLSLLIAVVYLNFDYFVFKVLISENYIYTETLDYLYEKYLGEVPSGGYFSRFDNFVIAAVTERIRAENGDVFTYLYTPPQYTEYKQTHETVARIENEVVELSPDTVYLRLSNISVYTKDFVYENRMVLNGYNNIIIDLQQNYGGDFPAFYDIAGLFLEKGAVIGTEEMRVKLFAKTVKAKAAQYFHFDNIVMLIDGDTASTAEGLVMALKENLDNVTVVGEKSFGKGIGQATINIRRGYAVKATIIRMLTPLGNSVDKYGIEPDITYTETDIAGFALKLIENKD